MNYKGFKWTLHNYCSSKAFLVARCISEKKPLGMHSLAEQLLFGIHNTAYSRDVCAVYIAGICAAFAEITEAGEYKGTFVHFCSTIF